MLHGKREGTLLLGEDKSSTAYQSRLDVGHFLYSFPWMISLRLFQRNTRAQYNVLDCNQNWLENAELIERNFLFHSFLKTFPGFLVSTWNCEKSPWALLYNSKSFFHSISSISKPCELILGQQSGFSVYQRHRGVTTPLCFHHNTPQTDIQVMENSSLHQFSITTCSEHVLKSSKSSWHH